MKQFLRAVGIGVCFIGLSGCDATYWADYPEWNMSATIIVRVVDEENQLVSGARVSTQGIISTASEASVTNADGLARLDISRQAWGRKVRIVATKDDDWGAAVVNINARSRTAFGTKIVIKKKS